MKVSSEQVINGLVRYVDEEVIKSLPTAGKWVVGTLSCMILQKAQDITEQVSKNDVVKMLGIIDEQGSYDLDLVIDNLKANATKYGKISIQVPLVGKLTFNDTDIESLKTYIESI